MFVWKLLRFANDFGNFLIFTVKTSNFLWKFRGDFENFGDKSKKKTDDSKISFMGWVTFSFMEIFYKSPPPSKLQKMAEGGGGL